MARGRDWESIRGVREARERGDLGYLVDALTSGDQAVRGSAARSLGLLGDERGVEPLLRLLNSSDEGLRVVAVKALGKIGDPVAAQPLYEAAVGGAPIGMRTEAMLALHRVGDPRGARMIAGVLVDPALPEQAKAERGVSTRSARRWARRLLGDENGVSGIEPLREALPELSGVERWRTQRLIRRLEKGQPRAS